MLEKINKMQGIQRAKISVEQRKEVSFQQLDLSGLGWSTKNWAITHALLAEYHDIFSLEPGELGCTDLAKHKVKVTDDDPFKERFLRIIQPMVDEVCTYVKEMLEAGTICPSQSMWCNAVVLVCKKKWSPCFCINFHKLNARAKKDSNPLLWIQEVIKSLFGAGCFSCLELKAGFRADHGGYTALTVGHIGFFECEHMLFVLCNALATFQRLMQNGQLNLAYCLIYLDAMIIFSKTEEEH